MLARAFAGTTVGVCGQVIQVEVDLSPGLPGINIVGLPDASIKESRERIRSAIRNSDLKFPLQRITVNLAPAVLRKEGVNFDLAIACAILAASEQLPQRDLTPVLCGELGLDGSIRPVRGALALAADLPRHGHRDLIVPAANAPEAALVPGVCVRRAATLREVVAHFASDEALAVQCAGEPHPSRGAALDDLVDFRDVRGQPRARRALEVAAAGQHNVLLTGPPGSGKTMLASRIATILPPLSFVEALEVMRVHSVAGQLPPGGRIEHRPVRAPHHTTSAVALVGGGPRARPGEVSLAHRGVLLLDELPEFRRDALEALRQPLVDGLVTIARANANYSYPAEFMLIGTCNPCPCGYRGDPRALCRCPESAVNRYRTRVSGPFLDRVDLQVNVPRVAADDLKAPVGESSAIVRARVLAARARQRARLERDPDRQHDGLSCETPNGRLSAGQVRRHCCLTPGAEHLLDRAARSGHCSARAYEKILKVALTLADLAASDQVDEDHIAEAIAYRALEPTPQECAA